MAETSGFFPDVSGDRTYTTDFLARWIASIIGNGVYDGDLAVAAGSNMQIIVPTGRAWINGYHYRNDGNLALAIDNADGVLNRKDTVVLRWDVNARSITAQVLKGAPASTATAPAIVRSVEQYDLKIAEISVPAGTTAITQALITDTRLDNSVCGIVTGVVKQVDTTKLYQQIQDDLAGFKATNEAGFAAWLNGIKDVLDENTAGNLLNRINGLAGDGRTTETVKANADAIAAHTSNSDVHVTAAQKDLLASAAQNATIGGASVPKSGTTLQLPAYPTNLPANGGHAASADTAGTSTYAHYPSHAVGLADFGLRGNYISSASPSGGNDGDTWDQV